MKIKFVTGNQRKIKEAKAACKDFGIEILQQELDIDEIQGIDPIAIAKNKAFKAYEAVGEPIVVTDTSWNILAVNGFPGGYMKDVARWFDAEDFIALVSRRTDRRIRFTETIVYNDGSDTKVFSEEYAGTIADSPRGDGNSIEQVAVFDGKTLAEAHGMGQFSHDPKDYVWYKFAKWFSEK